jgi:DNA end-binding protein Ku
MASTVWKGYISFGLVSVPVRLYTAARALHIGFHQIHAVCGTRVRQQLVCPTCERTVERSELAKGYPVEHDVNVLVTAEELRALEAESSTVMEIQQFVALADVDPIYFETSYYSVAEEPGRRAYALLLQSMRRLNLAAVARITMHGREQVVLIRPYGKGLALHTLYYPAEVRAVSEYGKDEDFPLQPQEIALAETFMQQLTAGFDPSQYSDTYSERVLELVASKQAGAAPRQEPQRKLAPVIDLMDALKKSLAAQPAVPTPEADSRPVPRKPPQRERAPRPAKSVPRQTGS